ncbi:hypothetical protein KR50_25320 [Jeotgalibacillus campisalis]|uniref:Uncharacterized protein n=1 Tax=Jeotgalibacillus campisalis TaxID=220754 RepID=A0A0C2R939_9BACL|nr:hypothetical protein KR50_25320 [Jeotgalibacillus campisalis]
MKEKLLWNPLFKRGKLERIGAELMLFIDSAFSLSIFDFSAKSHCIDDHIRVK